MARSMRTGTLVAILVTALNAGARALAQCVGDCQDQGEVSISDLILGVNIALGLQPADACPAFRDEGGAVTIAQLIKGVHNALNGCPPRSRRPRRYPAQTRRPRRTHRSRPGPTLRP